MSRFVTILPVFLTLFPVRAGAGDRLTTREYNEATKSLSDAVKFREPNLFLESLKTVLRREDARAVRAGVEAYASFAATLQKEGDRDLLYRLHSKTASSFSTISKPSVLKALHRERRKGRDWRARLLLLDAAAFNEGMDLEECCVQALSDRSPVVIRRALTYLARDEKVPIVEVIVDRYVELEAAHGRGRDSEWSRTLLAFRSALQQLLHVDLPAAVDWRNYIAVHKTSPRFFEGPAEPKEERTAITLFGQAVTGKNIIFVLDVSGSMKTTDPVTAAEREKIRRTRRRTVVGETGKKKVEEAERKRFLEDRRRMTRAKRELVRVVRSLPEDVRFNLIAYSSEVRTWKDSLLSANSTNKKAASEFVGGLVADGITVTDEALEQAFSDLQIDTVYLITDGAPTHVGSTTFGLPEDAEDLMAKIHKRVRVLNFLRDVRVFCLGFRGAEVEFLKELSRANRGRFVSIQ